MSYLVRSGDLGGQEHEVSSSVTRPKLLLW